MNRVTGYLIVDADGSMRAVMRYPNRLLYSEVAFPVTVTIPDVWGSVLNQQKIQVAFPDAPVGLSVGDAIAPEDGDE